MKRSEGKKQGQITIFVILALVIVSIILIFILWIRPNYLTQSGIKPGIEGCMESVIKENIKIIEKKYMGFPGLNFSYIYDGENIPYLCYTNLYLQPCINQRPFLLKHFSDELTKMSREGIMQCYENSLEDLKQKGFKLIEGEKELSIIMDPGQISVTLNAPISISSEGVAQSSANFKAIISSPIYDMLMIISYLVQQDTKYGDSMLEEAMLLRPEIKIQKIRRDDGNKVYIVENKDTKDIFKFATRSIAWPVGYDFGDVLMKRQ